MKALVTGGGGFLGYAIVKQLRAKNIAVHSYSRQRYDKLEQLDVTQFTGDLTDEQRLAKAAQGCDIIFHVAAKAGIWGNYDSYYQANVVGTENVIKVCRAQGIGKLVYTSSPSVVFNGQSMAGLDESLPYPDHYETAYPETKAIAERLIIAANDQQLATVSLRPHLIWGPEDNHLTPRIIERGRAGKLRRIGKQNHKVDCIYVDNAAHAHLLAAEHLSPRSPVSGKSYFISQDDPRNLWDIVNAILATAELPPVTKVVPFPIAFTLGAVCEWTYRWLNISHEPPMTRFLARELSTAHWFSMKSAKNDFGYTPSISIEEGLNQLKKWQKNTVYK
ncbi:MAG: NAD-dependent epimerase/dehydratase family protein [Desulfuromonas sp.]|nr:NAD-dependent epimerase/dehydratase family protein [Desulfuromonas sp.]